MGRGERRNGYRRCSYCRAQRRATRPVVNPGAPCGQCGKPRHDETYKFCSHCRDIAARSSRRRHSVQSSPTVCRDCGGTPILGAGRCGACRRVQLEDLLGIPTIDPPESEPHVRLRIALAHARRAGHTFETAWEWSLLVATGGRGGPSWTSVLNATQSEWERAFKGEGKPLLVPESFLDPCEDNDSRPEAGRAVVVS